MKRIYTYIILAFFLLVSCTSRDRYMTFTGFAQGGTYTVKLNLRGVSEKPEAIRDSVDALLRQIDFSLSGYNRNSILSRFNTGETVVPDSLFLDIYSHAYNIYGKTNGLVDAAAGPLFDIWGFGFKNGEMPDDAQVAQTAAFCGMKRLRPDMHILLGENGELNPSSLLADGVKDNILPVLNYNAIAQGYSCDVVARYLYSLGVKDMMVDIGEIFCDGVNPSGQPWTLGIDRPEDGNNEIGANIQCIFKVPSGPHGVVTSGNYRKFYVKDGRKYAHTINPQTGYPAEHHLLSATIVAPDAMMADAYATYCMVIGLEAAQEFIESDPALEGCLIYDDNGVFSSWTSSGFSDFHTGNLPVPPGE
ncbi:MAG: FAD:protein FMN transferase [Bacteroidales bacterium]|nr:FAD:protein FMN transferase [Bacteroidales bacterium]